MPKRKSNQNRRKKDKQRRNNSNTNNATTNANASEIDFDALIEQQINDSNQSHESISQMLQHKIAEMEESQKRQENAALFKKNVILQQLNMMKQQYESKQNDDDDSTDKHLQSLYAFITRINDIFYDVLDSETTLKQQSGNLIQQNETLKKLCQKLQEDKKMLNQHIKEIEQREKKWRAEIEGKFQSSLQDIKTKIGDHEDRYNSVVDENKKLREQLSNFLEYDKKRSEDFELYKQHQGKLDEIHDQEKENYQQMVEKEKMQTLKLTGNLKQAIEINDLLKARCNQYESKFSEMSKTVKESSKCIDEYKKMNIELMKQNKQLHAKLTDVMSKYKQLNSYNDQLDMRLQRTAKSKDTLSELCRKLQVKNKALSDDIKMAKNSLASHGVTDLKFKSDQKESPQKKPPQAQTQNDEENANVNEDGSSAKDDDGTATDQVQENDAQEQEQKESQESSSQTKEVSKDEENKNDVDTEENVEVLEEENAKQSNASADDAEQEEQEAQLIEVVDNAADIAEIENDQTSANDHEQASTF